MAATSTMAVKTRLARERVRAKKRKAPHPGG